MHTPGSVHSWLCHPLPLEFLAPICCTLFIEWAWWDQNNLITRQHNRILFMQYTLKWKTKKETKFILFINCSSLVPDTTVSMSVHQVFEEKVSLNFIYQFQSPETITIAPLSHYSKVPRVFFIFPQNLAIRLCTSSTENYSEWKARYLLFGFQFCECIAPLRKPCWYYSSVLPTHADVL